MATPHPSTFDPYAQEVIQNPYPFYASLREHAPVYKMPGLGHYVISRNEDIKAITLDVETYSSNIVAILMNSSDGTSQLMQRPELGVGPVDVLAIQDPPIHARQRQITQKSFSMRMVKTLEESLQDHVDQLLEKVLSKQEAEFMNEFAFRFPLAVILDMLGFPQDDLDQIKQWTDAAVSLLNGVSSPQELMQAGMAGINFFNYLHEKCQVALENPPDNLLGTLAQNTGSDQEDVLSFEEFVSSVLQLIIAGSESSASNIGNAVRILSENPELQAQLRQDPKRVGNFLEEVLRMESPFQGHFRLVKKDTQLHGVDLPEGSRLMLLWASGNRDESEYLRPGDVDGERENVRHHLAFGHGIHHCLGAPLARLEGKVALTTWLNRTDHFELAGDCEYISSVFVRTLKALPIRFTPSA